MPKTAAAKKMRPAGVAERMDICKCIGHTLCANGPIPHLPGSENNQTSLYGLRELLCT